MLFQRKMNHIERKLKLVTACEICKKKCTATMGLIHLLLLLMMWWWWWWWLTWEVQVYVTC